MTIIDSRTFRSGNSEAVRRLRNAAFGREIELTMLFLAAQPCCFTAPITKNCPPLRVMAGSTPFLRTCSLAT